MSCEGSSQSPGVSSGIHKVSLDGTNLMYVSGCLQQVSRWLQRNPAGIIGCSEHGCMSCQGSSMSPGVSSSIQEVSLDVANLMVHRLMSPAGLQVSPAESRRDDWMSRTLWYVFGCLQQVSRQLQQSPGGIIGCHEPHGMSLDVSSRSPGSSSRIQEVSLDVANLVVCLWRSPTGLQVSPAESRRYHWMS